MVLSTYVFVTTHFGAQVGSKFVGVVYRRDVIKTGLSIGDVALAFEVIQDVWIFVNSCAGTGGNGNQVVEQIRIRTCVDSGVEEQDDFVQSFQRSRFTEVEAVFYPLVFNGNVVDSFNKSIWTFQFEQYRCWCCGFYLNFEYIVNGQIQWLGQFGLKKAITRPRFFGVSTYLGAAVDVERIATGRVWDHHKRAIDGIPVQFGTAFKIFIHN